ncbi:MarR family transcriptional regulator [Leptolyngbya sp. AN03gr2]|uniref:MarR family transcriptional regulator n=1 Tax=unclassified Leptolyngbya TaxID=2650499 RepID=UPI003D31C817
MSPNVHHAPDNDDLIFAQADEEIQFAEEIESSQPEQSWKILIVDDDREVHEVTKLVLSDVTFENKSLSFISAYSAEEAKQILRSHSDIAIIFLDVVMETEDAGLQLVNYVREELGNRPARIILRTGQPGQAPETDVALNYGIDDYKLKTELTSEKLLLVVVTALRAFSTFMQMLEVSQKLRSQLSDYQQAETDLRSGSQTDSLIQSSPHREKIETLGQLVTEVTNDILHHSNATTFSMLSTINQIARLVLRLTDEQSAKLGLSQTKLSVLMYLNESPELCASPSSLAKHCGVSRAAMTGLLDGLEQESYVERDHNPADRRALKVRLTPKGQEFLQWIAPQGNYQFSELIETLDGAERQKMIQLAQKCLKILEARSPN